MNEFIEKLKEKLSRNRIFRLSTNSEGKNVFEIIDEVAEEYSHCTLCYLQSPCEYQNENAEMPMEYWERGWIPCENELPDTSEWHPSVVAKEFLVTYYPDEVTKPWVGIRYFRKDTNDFLTKKEEKVIAWQPLPKPYNPKGE